jgi:hypothetical protein
VLQYYFVPIVFPGATWDVRLPEEVGLDSAKLDLFVASVDSIGFIARDGYVVREWNSTSKIHWASAHKPVLSTLLMFAASEGLLSSIDDAVEPYVQQVYGQGLEPKDLSMTFRNLANMTSGYARAETPSAAWAYNDVAMSLYRGTLSSGVFGQSDFNLIALSPTRLGPLLFEDGDIFDPTGRLVTSARDFARIGWLWANEGNWDGVPLLPLADFQELWHAQVPAGLPRTSKAYVSGDYLSAADSGGGTDQTPRGPGVYGMNAWFNPGRIAWPSAPSDTFQANGHWNRKVLTVIPSLRLVAVWKGPLAEPDTFPAAMDANLALLMDAVLPPDCSDEDSDTFCIQHDCNDSDVSVFPGAPEIQDGTDNQCPGDEGFGLVDEMMGSMVAADLEGEHSLCWQPQPGANGYEIVRSNSPQFASDCFFWADPDTCTAILDDPSVGEVHFYLVRALDAGSWGQSDPAVERDPVSSCAGS